MLLHRTNTPNHVRGIFTNLLTNVLCENNFASSFTLLNYEISIFQDMENLPFLLITMNEMFRIAYPEQLTIQNEFYYNGKTLSIRLWMGIASLRRKMILLFPLLVILRIF